MNGEFRKQNPGRLRLRLTPEGMAFLIILVFVAVGAVLRSVNLLILLGGMMCAPLLLNWRSQIHLMKRLFCRRHVPQYIHAGELTSIQWECENSGSRLNAWNIVIQDSARNATEREDLSGSKRNRRGIHAEIVFPEIDVKRSSFVSYRTLFQQRGTYEFGPAKVLTTFPFGLMRSRRLLSEVQSVIVAPELGRLSHSWNRRLESVALGSEASRRRRGQEEDEFYALRKWRSGDSRRQIHWRSTAKYGTPMIRQHEQKTNRDLAIVVDLRVSGESSDSQTERDAELEQCETALSFAATVFARLGNAVQGQVALAVCGTKTQVLTERHHPETVVQIMRLLGTAGIGTLSNASPATSRGQTEVQDELLDAVMTTARCVSAGTPLFVVSPRSGKEAMAGWPANNSRIAAVQTSIHWLQTGSSELEEMFSKSVPEEKQQIESVCGKWASHVAR